MAGKEQHCGMGDDMSPHVIDGAVGDLQESRAVERRTFWACFAGCTLDNLDAQIYSLLIPSLIVAFGMDRAQAGLIATSTLLTGAIGGLAAGYLADRRTRISKSQQQEACWTKTRNAGVCPAKNDFPVLPQSGANTSSNSQTIIINL
ncbi:MAG: hypothetical protein EON55_27275 [Alphaproteobacteria bacterium]|nr:MAG: hypothetical protein EON55_27275 [Alphaproteobacteria bacterium]